MQRCPRSWLLICFLLLVPFTLNAQQYLFVFHDDTHASVYNPQTFELVERPTVGAGAITAIGVPGQATPSNLSRIYVVRQQAVAVLDPLPPFALRATFDLRAPVTTGERCAALTADGKRLVVIAGRFVHVFDATAAASPSTSIDLGAEITSMALLPNSERAFFTVFESPRVEAVSLNSNPPVRLAGPIELPLIATAIAAAPNASALYAAATGKFYEIDPVRNTVTREIEGTAGLPVEITFNPEAPVPAALVRHGSTVTAFDLLRRKPGVEFGAGNPLGEAISPGLDLVYFFSGTGQIYQGNLVSGGFGILKNPETSAPFDLPAIDLETDPSNQDVFMALGGAQGAIVRINAEASLLRNRLVPTARPTGLAVIASPGTVASELEVYGGDHQLASVGAVLPKPLVVRAIASNFQPAANQIVQFSTSTPNVSFRPPSPLTNNAGIAQTSVTVPITNPFTIQARILPSDLTATFEVNSALAEEEGLNIVSGDYQLTVGGTEFPRPFKVRALTSAEPIPNLVLTITPSNFAGTCPPTVTTDAHGEASFTCTSAAVVGTVATRIQVSDTFGRTLLEPFHVTVVNNVDKLPREVRLISPTPVVGQVNTTVKGAIEMRVAERLSGLPIPDVGIEFAAPGDVAVSPATAVTDGNGLARADLRFGCSISTNSVTATLNSTDLPTAVISHSSTRGPAARMIRMQGGDQSGRAGEVLPLALLARAADECGNNVSGAPLRWQVIPADAATLDNAFNQTNANGQASARVRVGTHPGPFTVQVGSGNAEVAVFNLTAIGTANRVVAISGDNQSAPAGAAIAQPLVVELQDAGGSPLPNTAVDFRITQGSGSLSSSRVTTDASGHASTTVTAGPQVGSLRVEASSGEGSFVFTLAVIGRTPAVTTAGFVNGASFVSGWTPGSTGSIFGAGLMEGVDGVVLPPAPFPTTLRGVQVLVENVPAPILSMANINGQEQINIQVPFGITAPGQVVVTVVNNGATATVPGVPIFAAQPGVFEYSLDGGRYAAVLHADYTLVEPARPAHPGEILQLFWTGGGATNPAVATNQPGPIPAAVTTFEVTVVANGVNAEVIGSFYAPTLVTVYQTNFRVPQAATGTTLKVQLMINGAQSQQATIPLAP